MSQTGKISLWALLTGGLVAALYGQFLHNPIVFDDLYYFMLDNDGHSAIEKFAHPQLFSIRGLPFATLAWTASWLGYGLPPFRIGNLLLHWLVVVALAMFVLRLYRTVLPALKDGEHTGMLTAVLISASLFALHPVAVYATGYLNERTIVMAVLFSLLSMWCYLKGSADSRRGWLWASVVLYFIATHSKEHVVMLPAAIVAMTVLLHEDWRARCLKNWPVFAGYALVALLTIVQARYAVGRVYDGSDEMLDAALREHAYLYSVLTQSWLFFKYGLLWALPNPVWMSVDMREPFAQGFVSVYGVALVAYLLYGYSASRLLLRRGPLGLAGFALLFPWLMFATEFSTVRLQEIFVLYRSYLWALGGVMLLPLLLMQVRERLVLLMSVLVAASLFVISMERLASFSSPLLLWDDAEKLVANRQSLPGVGRIYYNRGTEWLNAGQYDQAVADLQLAVRLSPKFPEAFGNLGVAYLRAGRNEQAIQSFSRAMALYQERRTHPNYRYYYGRAEAYRKTGRLRDAAVDYKVSCLLSGKMGCDRVEAERHRP